MNFTCLLFLYVFGRFRESTTKLSEIEKNATALIGCFEFYRPRRSSIGCSPAVDNNKNIRANSHIFKCFDEIFQGISEERIDL